MHACLRACARLLFLRARADVHGAACARLIHACLRACATCASLHKAHARMPAQHKGLLLPGEGRTCLLGWRPRRGGSPPGVAEPAGAAGAAAAGAR
eukprot:4259354-Lingulodinium_polyedra.AAC.1